MINKQNAQNENNRNDILKQKANTFFLLAIGALIFFSIIYGLFAFQYKTPQKSIIASGIFICLYFVYQGYSLIDISNKKEYEVDKYICCDILKTGYRKQNRKIVFLHSEKKEPFIYNTNKNMEFIKGMEYKIYFRKTNYRTSNSVLAISLLSTQKDFLNYKSNYKEKKTIHRKEVQ